MRENCNRTGPTLVGIGAQKCASSWVHAALGAHPQIGISNPKELDFFSYYFDRGYDWYEGFFSQMGDKTVRAEVSPSYFYDPRAPERLHKYNPNIRILVMLRDPIERIWSNHMHEVIKGHVLSHDFVCGLQNNPAYIEQSDYYRHLSLWLDVFPKSQIMVFLAEEIAENTLSLVERLYRFAQVDPTRQSPIIHERRNVSDQARYQWLRSGLRKGGDLIRRCGYEAELAHIKQLAPIRRVLAFNSRDIKAEIPPIDPGTYDRLAARFAPDLEPLARLLERPALPWPLWERRQDYV